MYGNTLYTDGKKTGECPYLDVDPGDTYGVSWEPGRVIFYKNGVTHHAWEVDIPDTPHVWGVVEMLVYEQVSIVQPGE